MEDFIWLLGIILVLVFVAWNCLDTLNSFPPRDYTNVTEWTGRQVYGDARILELIDKGE